MSRNKMLTLGLVALAGLAAYAAWRLTSRSGYEEAEYRVLEADGPFEVRQYAPLTLATTETRFAGQGNDGSFMRLFNYIVGENAGEQKVAMTIPVFMKAGEGSSGSMGFVLPRETVEQGVPDPLSDRVSIERRAAGRFAVYRFTGRISPKSSVEAEDALRDWVANRRYAAGAATEIAGYDPPWTPGPFRRNEVLVRID